MGFLDFLKPANGGCSSFAKTYVAENGKVYRYDNANSKAAVYSSSPKAVKALMSPDSKRVLILRENGSVIVMDTSNKGIRTVYNETGNLAAQDIVWDGNNSFQIKTKKAPLARRSQTVRNEQYGQKKSAS